MNNLRLESRPTGYNSVIASWDSKSAVRSKPRRHLAEEDKGCSFFSADLTPEVTHSLMLARGSESIQELLTRRLYSYLDFTTILEQEIVNPVVLSLSRDAFGLKLPGDMKFDAYRIYCDEAYHALFSVDLKRQIESSTKVLPTNNMPEPHFGRVIRRIEATMPESLRGLVGLCAAVVSETLISGSLTKVPTDSTVVNVIREVIADHAADERTHHAYFTKVLEMTWPQLDKSTKQLLGPHFADFILAFLAPDGGAQQSFLTHMKFSPEEVEQILHESHPFGETLADVRQAARSTIRLLQRTGILDDSRTIYRFQQLELIR